MREFTADELSRYDGRDGTLYVAYDGKVFDVSRSYHWRHGRHHFRHFAGCDLTLALVQAPHGADVLSKFPVVGILRAD